MQKLRNSNIELMRIVAILFVISHHFLLHGMNIWEDMSWNNFTLLALDSSFYIAVNVFILISGYCGIRFEWKKILRLYLLTAFIAGLCSVVHMCVDKLPLSRNIIYHTVFAISHTETWFVKIYVYLFLLSPILNAALNSFNKKQMHTILLILTMICIYFGWVWKDAINPYGYSLIIFVWIYSIGFYLAHHFVIRAMAPIVYLLIWIFASAINAIFSIMLDKYAAWTYHNPLIVMASIAFFLFFLSFTFSSKIINIVAQSILGIYLIHENGYVARFIYGDLCSSFYKSNISYFLISVVLLFIVCATIDFVVRYIFVQPLYSIISRYLPSKDIFRLK